ncbi:MAG: DUF1636 family protein [Aestuariivirga sp.]
MRSIVMCTTCRFSPEAREAPDGRTGGQVLIAHVKDAIAARDADIEVVEQACLWNCNRPCSVIFRDDQRFTYVSGGHAPEREQAEAILDWFAMHGETPTGEVPFRQWPDRMRGHFIARIPPVKP